MTERTHALEVLEFGRVLGRVADRAVSAGGSAHVRALGPCADVGTARQVLEGVTELKDLLLSAEGWQLEAVPDLEPALQRLALDAAMLDAAALSACAAVMSIGRSARSIESKVKDDGVPGQQVRRLWGDVVLEKRISRTFDDAGTVTDRASTELGRIRRMLVNQRARLVDRLEQYARGLPERSRVSDGSVTVRNGRYCIPVRRVGKGSVGGLVHDASASRQTLFIEPAVAIDAMNDIRELELGETREVERILRALSDDVRAVRSRLADSYEALIELDSLRARAVFAAELDASPPAFTEEGGEAIQIRAGRHPLLATTTDGAIPFDLTLTASERVLLVSGPNAGGKTVLLKTIGLISALAQSGIVPPLGPGTKLPFYRRIFAVIGDEQSIDASLSTFGAQARNLAEILSDAGPRDLVLIDEIGSATDPSEGGALAAAALTRLAGQARLTLATTHLGDLKRLGDEGGATVNASLEFDAHRLEPTYRLVRDRPGRSYALVIAARLGVPDDVLADARARMDQEHVSLDALLERLESERADAANLRVRLEEQAANLAEERRRLDERAAKLESEERAASRDREVARNRVLMKARRLVAEAIDELEERFAVPAEREAAARNVRSTIEREIRDSGKVLRSLGQASGGAAPGSVLQTGDTVRWRTSNRTGVLVELRGGRGVVEVDGLRLTVPVGELMLDAGADDGSGTGTGSTRRSASTDATGGADRGRRPEFRVSTELDLRGLRVDEVEGMLYPALDAAVVGEIPSLRIIHGKGTGALREWVQRLLSEDDRIKLFRSGEPNEGGSGVTLVEFE